MHYRDAKGAHRDIALSEDTSGPIRAAWDQQEQALRAASEQQALVAQQWYPAALGQPLPAPMKAPPRDTPPLPPVVPAVPVLARVPAAPPRQPQPRPGGDPGAGAISTDSTVLEEEQQQIEPHVQQILLDNEQLRQDQQRMEPQLQTLVEHLQQAAQAIGDHVATLGEKVAAMETEAESEASTVVKKFDDINSCLQELNQKVTSVLGLHGSIDEMQKKYAEMKAALEAMEEREQATSNKLSRAIRAIRHGEMPSSGSGGSGDSFCTEAAVADAEDGAARPDLPVDGMGSSGVLVQHEKVFQLGASTFVSMAENHVSGTH